MEQTTAAKSESPAAKPGLSCSHCGEPGEKGQLVCLRCGGRLALDYRRPPGWKLPTAIVATVGLVAAVAFGWALRAVTHNAKTEVANAPAGKPTNGGTPKTPATQPKPKTPAAAKKQAKPKRPSTATRKPPAPSPAAAAVNFAGTWPAAKNGFTVVLTSTDNPSSAKDTARGARQSGVRAGYLRSNDYPSLQKGFWYVYGGVYNVRGQAEKAAAKFVRGYPGAYVQWVDGATAARRAAKRKKR
jgi:hypothetical protein